jgi:hypothetical protein
MARWVRGDVGDFYWETELSRRLVEKEFEHGQSEDERDY